MHTTPSRLTIVCITCCFVCLALLGGSLAAPPGLTAQPAIQTYEGSLDTSFDPGTGADEGVDAVVLQADGKVLIGGNFSHYNGTSRNRIARLNSDGSLDPSFNPGTGTGAGSRVFAVALQADNRILIGGAFMTYDGVPRVDIARLNTDGSLDSTFNPGNGPNGPVLAVLVQPDGKILIGGSFETYNGTGRGYIARLNANGSLDTSFDPGTGADNRVHSLARQSDGKILIGGYFNQINGTDRHHVARLNSNGTLDTGFDPGEVTSPWAIVYSIVVQPDNKILFGGSFDTYNGVARSGIARANANGLLDATFDPGEGTNNPVYAVVRQADGKILIAGAFDGYDRVGRGRIARLNANGSLDTSFDPGPGANQIIDAIALQPDGKVLIGGTFTTYGGIGRNCIARLNGPRVYNFHLWLPVILRP